MIKLRGLIELPQLSAGEIPDIRNTPDMDYFLTENGWHKTLNFYFPYVVEAQGLDCSFEQLATNIENYAHSISATHYRYVYSCGWGEVKTKDSELMYRYMGVFLFKKKKSMVDTIFLSREEIMKLLADYIESKHSVVVDRQSILGMVGVSGIDNGVEITFTSKD